VWKDGGGLVAPVFQLYRFWGEDGVWWRLVSPNGRGLARSAGVYPTVASARASLEQVLSRADGLELGVRLTPDYRWHWSLRMAGAALVEGIGDQDRRVRCLDAGRKFQLLAPVALVEPEVAVFRRAGRMPRVEHRGAGRGDRAEKGGEKSLEKGVEKGVEARAENASEL
jgi:hypothetical protein